MLLHDTFDYCAREHTEAEFAIQGSRSVALSLVRGDALLRLQRRIGLVPEGGLGVARRALALAAFSWLPIALPASRAPRPAASRRGSALADPSAIALSIARLRDAGEDQRRE